MAITHTGRIDAGTIERIDTDRSYLSSVALRPDGFRRSSELESPRSHLTQRAVAANRRRIGLWLPRTTPPAVSAVSKEAPMSDDTPTDRAVVAFVERIALAVDWISRYTVGLTKQWKAALHRIRQRLVTLGRSRR